MISAEAFATLGGAIALAGGVIGSAVGIAIAGTAGAAILSVERAQLRNVIILASLPMSRTFYGLLILILILTTVVPKLGAAGDASSGFAVFACGIIAALAEGVSGAYQGAVCASGISFLPKTRGRILLSSIMLAVFVELVGVLGLVFTIMALGMLGFMG